MSQISLHPDVRVYNHTVNYDYRGELWTLWKEDEFPHTKLKFNHDKVSTSRKDVLRGIHGDYKSWKLVECLYGELYFVIVDNRPESKNYKKWSSMMLSDKTRQSILLPPGFGNGFLVMSEHSIFHYKWYYEGNYPDVEEQFSINWKDPSYNFEWPINNPILSFRDSNSKFI
jgi:dTDP-4-dehydrorhamnose 3,5-epimerase